MVLHTASKMAAEVREAEQRPPISDSDSSTPTGFLEANDESVPGRSSTNLLLRSDSFEDLSNNGALPSVSTSGTIHTIQRRAKRSGTGTDGEESGNDSSANRDADTSSSQSQGENVEVCISYQLITVTLCFEEK